MNTVTSPTQHRGTRARATARRIAAASLSLVSLVGLGLGMPTADAAAVTRVDLYYSRYAPSDGGQSFAYAGTAPTTTTATSSQETGVVLINTQLPNGTGAGTGMVLTANGVVLTNYHVVEGSSAVQVTIADTGQTYVATVLGHDATKDVAVLQIQGAQGLATVKTDTSGVTTGETVTAVGNAQGAQQLVQASGQVTDPQAQVTASDDSSGTNSETLTDVFQTNVAAQPGDSGGPMYDAQGEVVGMTTAGAMSSGSVGRYRQTAVVTASESYAVQIGQALAVVDQVTAGREGGTVEIGAKAYLGVELSGPGLTLAGVSEGTPAAAAGLAAGDTLTAVGDRQVSTDGDLQQVLAGLQPGQRVTVQFLDGTGATQQVTLTLASSPLN